MMISLNEFRNRNKKLLISFLRLDSMTSVSDDTISNYGKHSQTASIACQLLLSVKIMKASLHETWFIDFEKIIILQLTRKSSAVTAASVPICSRWSRFDASCAPLTCPIKVSCATCSGRIPTRTRWAGVRMIAVWASHSVQRWVKLWIESWSAWKWLMTNNLCRSLENSSRSMTLTWSVGPIRSWKMAMSSLPSDNWWHCSQHPTTVASSITQVSSLYTPVVICVQRAAALSRRSSMSTQWRCCVDEIVTFFFREISTDKR